MARLGISLPKHKDLLERVKNTIDENGNIYTTGELEVDGDTILNHNVKIDGSLYVRGLQVIPNSYAPKASPAFTGTPTSPTPSIGDNSTKIATTEFVNKEIMSKMETAEAMVLAGIIDASTGKLTKYNSLVLHSSETKTLSANTLFTDLDGDMGLRSGCMFKIAIAGTISGTKLEVGDSIVVTNVEEDQESGWHISWYAMQSNIDKATASTLGLVKVPSANGLSVDANGSLSIATATQSSAGAMSAADKTKLDKAITSDNIGSQSVANATNATKATQDGDGNSITSTYETKLRSTSRGTNLITNGNGMCGDNTNFSQFIYDPTVCNASVGSFTKSRGGSHVPILDDYIIVDPTKRTKFSFDLISLNKTGTMFGVLFMYDIDKREITDANIMFRANTLTFLTQDLNNGDTVVHLADISNWIDSSVSYQRRFIFWDYVNNKGNLYLPETYSRHVVSNVWNQGAGLNKTDNTITLRIPWSGGTIKAGTKLSQGNEGATYSYFGLVSSVTPTAWTNYAAVYNGTDYSGNNANGKFRPGTAYVRIGFLWNYNKADDQIWVTNVSAYELHDAGNADTLDGKHASDFLQLSGGTMTGEKPLVFTPNKPCIAFREYNGYHCRVGYYTLGTEALVFANQSPVSTFMFHTGKLLPDSAMSDWQSFGDPDLQIKNKSLSINKLIPNGANPSYNLDVNGTANATTLFENGKRLSHIIRDSKYKITGSVGDKWQFDISFFDKYFIGNSSNNVMLRFYGTVWLNDVDDNTYGNGIMASEADEAEDVPDYYTALRDGYALVCSTYYEEDEPRWTLDKKLVTDIAENDIVIAVNDKGDLSYVHPSFLYAKNETMRFAFSDVRPSGTVISSNERYAKAKYILDKGGSISARFTQNNGNVITEQCRLSFETNTGLIYCYFNNNQNYFIIAPDGYEGGDYGYY